MRRLELTEIARADLKSIRRYSLRTWGPDQTVQYMAALRDTMKGLVAGTVLSRDRHDLRSGLQMATSGRHCVFFEADQSRVLVVRALAVGDEATRLAGELVRRGALPTKAAVDAFHIGIAAAHQIDYLLTWNCKHIANATMRGTIEAICRSAGLTPPIICTPEELPAGSSR